MRWLSSLMRFLLSPLCLGSKAEDSEKQRKQRKKRARKSQIVQPEANHSSPSHLYFFIWKIRKD